MGVLILQEGEEKGLLTRLCFRNVAGVRSEASSSSSRVIGAMSQSCVAVCPSSDSRRYLLPASRIF